MLRQLFVTGSQHAGVFDVGMLLNEHPRVLLGVERFTRVPRMADPFLLAPERLVAPLSVETKIRGELLYARLAERVGSPTLEVVGDVDPGYVLGLDAVDTRLGRTRIVVVVDDPAPAGIDEWRRTLGVARESEDSWLAAQILMVPYPAFVAGDGRWLRALLAFLGLPSTDRIQAEYARLCIERSSGSDAHTLTGEDAELLAWWRARTAADLHRHCRDLPDDPVDSEPLLTAEELAARALEREQLLTQRCAGSVWPGQGQALEQRYIEQAHETVNRGRRIRQAALTAAVRLPLSRFRVNLIGPPARTNTIGRSDAMQQLARHLGRLCTVRLFASEPPHVPLSGAEWRSDNDEAANDCDVVIYPGDLPDAARLLNGTRAAMLLDGFETPGDQVVSTNLMSAREVIASSQWLCQLAREHGVPAIYRPLGLNRVMFAAGPPSDQRELHVTGVSQAADWMGGPELSEALVRVREARPEVEVTLFGNMPADGATNFVARPRLGQLAQALRSSAVHVASARQEGFGFIGAAALACGAALVTTDTDGSREYAVDGRTALVTRPGDPEALATGVLALLDDVSLRTRLVAAGGSHVRSLMPSWAEAARALAVLLTERA